MMPLGPVVKPGLDLVEGQQRVVPVQQLAQPGQVAVVGRDDPGVHHHRLKDHSGDLTVEFGQRPLDRAEIVERDDHDQVADRGRDAGVAGDAVRTIARADLVRLGQHGHLHRVVVPVVAALDLDDHVAAGDRAHQVHRVHRGFGAGVGEAPQRQLEAAGQLGGDPDRVVGGLGEVRPAPHPVGHRGDDRRVGVPGDRDAVPAVHVDVLGAVDVVDLRAAPWLIHTACGCAICQFDVAPPARCRRASSINSVLRGWRRRKTRSSSAMRSSMPSRTSSEAVATAGETTLKPPLFGGRAMID